MHETITNQGTFGPSYKGNLNKFPKIEKNLIFFAFLVALGIILSSYLPTTPFVLQF